MRGQGKRKKIKVNPRLVGGGEWEENDGGGGAGDNLPGNAQHPLLTEVVMEVLFKQFSLLNHDDDDDDSPKSALAHLAELRLVCKAWNQEIGKMIRKETQINVKRLVSTYPKGLGWAATTNTTDEPNIMTFKYSAPMPEEIGTFENLCVTIKKCKKFTKTSIVKWFQVMGSSVKSLHLTCHLCCPHQNHFVEKMLKEWCPNLSSFTLQGAQCFDSLLQNSFFAEPSVENECRSLKEFILFSDDLHLDSWSKVCGLRIENLELSPADQLFQNVALRKKIHENRSTFVRHLINYLGQAGEATTSVAQEEDLLNKLVRRPIGLTSLDGMTPRTFGSHVADFFKGKFSSDHGHENDGGIIGQLMKMSSIERFVIQKANERQEWFFNELFAIFFYRPNLWGSTLQHFECIDHLPATTAVDNCMTPSAFRSRRPNPKNIFSKVGFPLKRLKFVRGALTWDESVWPEKLESILSGCAETLEELELVFGTSDDHCRIILPMLPSLKVLVVQSSGNRAVKVTSQDILRKFPKLERCVLMLGRNGEWSTHSFFGGDDQDGDSDDEDGDKYVGLDWGSSHPLKELKLLDEYVDERAIEQLVMSFPNLKIVNLSIVQESGEGFKAFWEKMGELPLEQVKLSFSVMSRIDMADDLYENAIRDNIEGFKDLEWLELVHDGLHWFPLTSRFSKGFVGATKLRVLKFISFQVEGNEGDKIKKNFPNAVVQLPAMKMSLMDLSS